MATGRGATARSAPGLAAASCCSRSTARASSGCDATRAVSASIGSWEPLPLISVPVPPEQAATPSAIPATRPSARRPRDMGPTVGRVRRGRRRARQWPPPACGRSSPPWPPAAPGRRRGGRRWPCSASAASPSPSTTGAPASPPAETAGSRGTVPISGTPASVASAAPPPSPNTACSWPCSQRKALMFSITPSTWRWLLRAMVTARLATRWAAIAGVVTTSISACGSIRARPIWTSPVPGGRSMTR